MRMTLRARLGAFGIAFGLALVGAGASWAQDAAAVVDQRQNLMKTRAKAAAAIKGFLEGKNDLASAQSAGAELLMTTAYIPSLFPQNTGMAQFPGKSYAKPDIWTEWDRFTQAA